MMYARFPSVFVLGAQDGHFQLYGFHSQLYLIELHLHLFLIAIASFVATYGPAGPGK